MKKTSKSEIKELRTQCEWDTSGKGKTRIPYAIIRKADGLYLEPLTREMESQKYEKHLCNSCARCHARSDEDGGCQKVVDIDKFPEDYDFIVEGVETERSFWVLQCEHYELETPAARITGARARKLKNDLVDFMYG